jgi:hypothetical protein
VLRSYSFPLSFGDYMLGEAFMSIGALSLVTGTQGLGGVF